MPVQRAAPLQQMLDDLARSMFGRTAGEAISTATCMACGKPVTGFKNEISAREYEISGLCQECQDIAFADPDEDEDEI